jgi:serine acetyltransferase
MSSRLRETLRALHRDCERLNQAAQPPPPMTWSRQLSLLLRPEVAAVGLFRMSHYFLGLGWGWAAHAFYRANLLLTGADIRPESVIGPGCLIVHTVGTVIHGRLGRDTTIFAHVVIAARMPTGDLEAAPRLGDRVSIGSAVSVLGAVRIADDVSIAPYSVIDTSVEQSNCVVIRRPSEDTMSIVRKVGSSW